MSITMNMIRSRASFNLIHNGNPVWWLFYAHYVHKSDDKSDDVGVTLSAFEIYYDD